MLLLVGLGNPTPDSENNRHNIGFKIIDAINKKQTASIDVDAINKQAKDIIN